MRTVDRSSIDQDDSSKKHEASRNTNCNDRLMRPSCDIGLATVTAAKGHDRRREHKQTCQPTSNAPCNRVHGVSVVSCDWLIVR
eukprot:688739-Alexandrium_andersonii.AAC.1